MWNTYLLLLDPIMPPPHDAAWREDLLRMARAIREHFYYPKENGFADWPVGVEESRPSSTSKTAYGRSAKCFWFLYLIGKLANEPTLVQFSLKNAPALLEQAFLGHEKGWAWGIGSDPQIVTANWWLHAEIDQLVATLGLSDPSLALQYLPHAYEFWFSNFVDDKNGEIWEYPNRASQLKVHPWKNGYHSFEHALVAYITTLAYGNRPVSLFYAPHHRADNATFRPYYFEGDVKDVLSDPLSGPLSNYKRARVTFENIR